MTRRIQIGVIGSASQEDQSQELQKLAYEIGQEIAKSNAIVVYGAEKDVDSLSNQAAQGANEAGGTTIAIVYGSEKNTFSENNSIIIATGQERGGGREFSFVLSCDSLISIAGGSGTLMEMSMAYQNKIPVVALENTGGCSGQFAGKFIDERKREIIHPAKSPEEAVQLAVTLSKQKNGL